MNHWTDQDILQHLMGIGPEDGHASACPECRDRIGRARDRAARLATEPVLEPAFLAGQRRAILARAERPVRRTWLAAIPAGAAACLAVVLLVPRPAAPPHEPLVASNDQLYLEIYQAIEADVPRAAQPIQGLFER